MLAAAGLDPPGEIAFIAHRAVSVTAEKVAINAVMAGCKPEYMPVVVAAVEGHRRPAVGLSRPGDLDRRRGRAHDRQRADRPRARLQLRATICSGPGWRANATIGRAVRLVMRNVIGTLPGDARPRHARAIPASYTYVIAENEAESPWTPLHVERGFRPEQSAVTVMAAEAPHQFYNQLSSTAEGILTTLCDDMRDLRERRGPAELPSWSSPASTCGRSPATGGPRREIRQFVFEHTQNSHRASQAHAPHGRRGPAGGRDARLRPLVESPDDILVVAAGGRAGAFSCLHPRLGRQARPRRRSPRRSER